MKHSSIVTMKPSIKTRKSHKYNNQQATTEEKMDTVNITEASKNNFFVKENS